MKHLSIHRNARYSIKKVYTPLKILLILYITVLLVSKWKCFSQISFRQTHIYMEHKLPFSRKYSPPSAPQMTTNSPPVWFPGLSLLFPVASHSCCRIQERHRISGISRMMLMRCGFLYRTHTHTHTQSIALKMQSFLFIHIDVLVYTTAFSGYIWFCRAVFARVRTTSIYATAFASSHSYICTIITIIVQ